MRELGAKRVALPIPTTTTVADSSCPIPTKVKSIIRVRPGLASESSHSIISVDEHQAVARLINPRNPNELLSFQFDGCWGATHDIASQQLQIFLRNVVPVAKKVLEGFNATIFAYGNTGAGKTFTMEGTDQAPGTQLN